MNEMPAHVAEAYATREDAMRRHADTQHALDRFAKDKSSALKLLETANENLCEALFKEFLGWADDPNAVEEAREYVVAAQRQLADLEIIEPALRRGDAKWEMRALNGPYSRTIARYEQEQRDAQANT